jgi:hypothetical protein
VRRRAAVRSTGLPNCVRLKTRMFTHHSIHGGAFADAGLELVSVPSNKQYPTDGQANDNIYYNYER